MSLYQDMTYISLLGTRENVVRMLNAVIRTLGNGNVITDDDDIETINNKIKADDGYGFRIAIPDLLDEESMKDAELMEKKSAYEKKIEFESEQAEFEYDSSFEDYTDARMIDILGVFRYQGKLDVELEKYECEGCAYYRDWLDWDDIARIYGCRILEDHEQHLNGAFDEFCGTNLYEPKEGAVESTRIEPKLEVFGYFNDFDKLVDMCPERYRSTKVKCMEAKVRELQHEIAKEKLNLVVDQLEENDGRALIPSGVTEIPELTFQNCTELVSVEIPEGVEYIGSSAFYGCTNLKSIFLPASLKDFSLSAFDNCGLESIEVHPDNVTFRSEGDCIIDRESNRLLRGCRTSVIPSSVIKIGNNAFTGCTGLKEIVIPGNVESIGNNAFERCCDLRRAVLQEGVKSIGGNAFYACGNLEGIALPKSLATIYVGAFASCSSLKEILIPEGIKVYTINLFSKCSSLERVVLPDGIDKIDSNAFADCTSLRSIVIPEGVQTIGYQAFRDCTNLADVVIPDSVLEIKEGAFDGCPCLEKVKDKYSDIMEENQKVLEKTPEESEDMTAYNKLIDENGHAAIPEGTTEIDFGAFENCRGLVSVDIPSSVKVIKCGAFAACTGLTSIVIPDNVEDIQEFAFKGCTSLSDVTLPKNADMDFEAFEGCPFEEEFLKILDEKEPATEESQPSEDEDMKLPF